MLKNNVYKNGYRQRSCTYKTAKIHRFVTFVMYCIITTVLVAFYWAGGGDRLYVRLIHTRNSSGDEIADVNFIYDDTVHALENTRLLHKFRHRLFSATQVYQIHWNTQCNGHYAVQGHSSHRFWYQSKAHIRLPISDYTNLPPILHRFQVMGDDWSNFR